MKWEEQKKQFQERRKEIYQKHKSGMSYSKLAKEYDVTASRIGLIVQKERKDEAKIAKE